MPDLSQQTNKQEKCMVQQMLEQIFLKIEMDVCINFSFFPKALGILFVVEYSVHMGNCMQINRRRFSEGIFGSVEIFGEFQKYYTQNLFFFILIKLGSNLKQNFKW